MKLGSIQVLLICLWGLFVAGTAQASGYVVAKTGSDANPGTAAKPFATIQKAADTAHAGDSVRVKTGIYREAVHLHNSGTAASPIQFVADPPGSVVVTGADVMTGWTRVEGEAPIYQIQWDHVFAIDYRDGKPIEAHPEDEPLWGRAEQVIADKKQLLPCLSLDDLRKAWADHAKTPGPTVPSPLPNLGGPFAGMFMVDTTHKTLSLWLVDGSDPNAHRMEAATRSQTFGVNQWENKDGVAYVQVRGFVFRYGASFPQRAVVSLHGAHNLMQNCIVEDMAGAGVAVAGTMTGCIVRGCGQTGGSAGGDGFVNKGCLWEGNCWKPIDRGWDAGGVKMALTNGGLFQNCVFRRNGGPGLWFDIDMRHVRVTQCVFQENEGTGLMIEISRFNQVDHCLSVGNAVGIVGKSGAGDWASSGILLAESEDCRVTNNTCVGNKDGITFREQGPRPLDTPDGTIPYHDTRDVVMDNICAFNHGYQIGLWYDNGFFGRHPGELVKYPTEAVYSDYLKTIPDKVFDPTRQTITIDHNLYWPLPGKPVALYGVPWRIRHQEFARLADFMAHTGFDAHSKIEDPRFVNQAKGNYKLGSGSSAVSTGAGWQNLSPDSLTWITAGLPKWMRAAEPPH
jgi:hypothetical protein